MLAADLLSRLQRLCRSSTFTSTMAAFLRDNASTLEPDGLEEVSSTAPTVPLQVIRAHNSFIELMEALFEAELDAAGASWEVLEEAFQSGRDSQSHAEIISVLAPVADLAAFRESLVVSSLSLEAELLARWRTSAAATSSTAAAAASAVSAEASSPTASPATSTPAGSPAAAADAARSRPHADRRGATPRGGPSGTPSVAATQAGKAVSTRAISAREGYARAASSFGGAGVGSDTQGRMPEGVQAARGAGHRAARAAQSVSASAQASPPPSAARTRPQLLPLSKRVVASTGCSAALAAERLAQTVPPHEPRSWQRAGPGRGGQGDAVPTTTGQTAVGGVVPLAEVGRDGNSRVGGGGGEGRVTTCNTSSSSKAVASGQAEGAQRGTRPGAAADAIAEAGEAAAEVGGVVQTEAATKRSVGAEAAGQVAKAAAEAAAETAEEAAAVTAGEADGLSCRRQPEASRKERSGRKSSEHAPRWRLGPQIGARIGIRILGAWVGILQALVVTAPLIVPPRTAPPAA
mgnify:CR=1 FL=1